MILPNNVVGQFMYRNKGAESKSDKQFLLFFFFFPQPKSSLLLLLGGMGNKLTKQV